MSVAEPDHLGDFIKDKVAAIALGKSLFWDMQVGSDGIQSCASCHFHAGADSRSKNQLSSGLLLVNADKTPNPDKIFNTGGPNYTLKPEDYPFHKLADPNNRLSTVLADTNDVTCLSLTDIRVTLNLLPTTAPEKPRMPCWRSPLLVVTV